MPHADRVDLAGKWPLQGRARTRGERRGNRATRRSLFGGREGRVRKIGLDDDQKF